MKKFEIFSIKTYVTRGDKIYEARGIEHALKQYAEDVGETPKGFPQMCNKISKRKTPHMFEKSVREYITAREVNYE